VADCVRSCQLISCPPRVPRSHVVVLAFAALTTAALAGLSLCGTSAGSAAASQRTLHICNRRGYADRRGECRHLPRRPLPGGRTRYPPNSRMPRTQCTVLQRVDSTRRAKEAHTSFGGIVGRVRQCYHDCFWQNAVGWLRQSVRMGCDRGSLRGSRNPGVGGMVYGRVKDTSCARAWARDWVSSGDHQG
jgi:hypothetical protein